MITSANNERLKHARRVRTGREPALLFIEGERQAEECLHSNLRISAAFYRAEPKPRVALIIEALQARACPLFALTETVFAGLSDTVQAQGIILLAERPHTDRTGLLSLESPLLIGLDAVQDPGNVGTIIRTAEAAGAHGLLALTGTTDVFAPKALRAAMGSAFRLPIATKVAGAALRDKCNEHRIQLVGTAATGELAYAEYDWRQPTLLLLGNEANGVSPTLLAQCDSHVRIPLHPPVESLNVATAAAVLLFEAARQRA